MRFLWCGLRAHTFFDWSDYMKSRYVLANALCGIDFDLLTSDNMRNKRGYWGEIMELVFPSGVIFIYIDENDDGFLKIYEKPNCKLLKNIPINVSNLFDEMVIAIQFAKTALQ